MEGRVEDNARYLSQLIAIEPNSAKNYNALASDYLTLGMYKAARAMLDKALEMQPDLWPAHSFMVELNLTTGEIEQAEKHAQALIALELGGTQATTPMVWVLIRKGDYRASVPYVENPAFQGTFERAFVYHKLGEKAKEEQALKEMEADYQEKMRSGGDLYAIEGAEIAFLRGDKEDGYRQLERARDKEWIMRSGERFMFQTVFFPELKKEARFQRLERQTENRLAAMRQRVRAEGL
jgi:tetratricopeptide (TPR) repeat protein